MQAGEVLKHIKEEAARLKNLLDQLDQEPHLTAEEATKLLEQVERIYRGLSAYTYLVKKREIGTDMQVHLKIMQTVSGMENNITADKIAETPKEEPVEEKEPPQQDYAEGILRKIELSINNKFRISNELFNQNQQEFNAALQQLNSMSSKAEAMHYMDSLKHIYKWKDENPLVKNFYALVQKRFA